MKKKGCSVGLLSRYLKSNICLSVFFSLFFFYKLILIFSYKKVEWTTWFLFPLKNEISIDEKSHRTIKMNLLHVFWTSFGHCFFFDPSHQKKIQPILVCTIRSRDHSMRKFFFQIFLNDLINLYLNIIYKLKIML